MKILFVVLKCTVEKRGDMRHHFTTCFQPRSLHATQFVQICHDIFFSEYLVLPLKQCQCTPVEDCIFPLVASGWFQYLPVGFTLWHRKYQNPPLYFWAQWVEGWLSWSASQVLNFWLLCCIRESHKVPLWPTRNKLHWLLQHEHSPVMTMLWKRSWTRWIRKRFVRTNITS